MPFPYDPKNALVRVCTTLAGTYTVVGKVRTATTTEGQENRTKTKYLGGQVIRPGDNTATGSVAYLWDRGDTTGQELVRTAKRNGTTLFLQICPDGVGTGAKVEQLEINVTQVTTDINADNEMVEGGFDWEGVDDAPTTITLA